MRLIRPDGESVDARVGMRPDDDGILTPCVAVHDDALGPATVDALGLRIVPDSPIERTALLRGGYRPEDIPRQ